MIESSYFNTRATRSRLKENNTTEEVKIEPKKKSVASKLSQQKRKGEIKSADSQNGHIDERKEDKIKDTKKLKWEPALWREQIQNIYEMRKERNAPVDTMGCDVISDKDASPETRDEVTSAAMAKLRQHGCTIENILKTSDTKVKYIKNTSEILKNEYEGDIPRTVKDLCKLPGVGPKMAFLVMKCAWNEVLGIGVDTHVHRIANRLQWVKKPTKDPESTRKELEDWLPREYWQDINHLLVGFGQQTCLPLRPKCAGCLNKDICPVGKANLRYNKNVKVE
ncbi:hypothetical protein KUTeg_024888, partial [Tegillarca granosa]